MCFAVEPREDRQGEGESRGIESEKDRERAERTEGQTPCLLSISGAMTVLAY